MADGDNGEEDLATGSGPAEGKEVDVEQQDGGLGEVEAAGVED